MRGEAATVVVGEFRREREDGKSEVTAEEVENSGRLKLVMGWWTDSFFSFPESSSFLIGTKWYKAGVLEVDVNADVDVDVDVELELEVDVDIDVDIDVELEVDVDIDVAFIGVVAVVPFFWSNLTFKEGIFLWWFKSRLRFSNDINGFFPWIWFKRDKTIGGVTVVGEHFGFNNGYFWTPE